ncbi:MAG TPA: rhomboid family intramembrane serine protease [Gemmataceae bacterium]|nr:rhomboid family intramembrane serine protease [Gemmataceae bacterium]
MLDPLEIILRQCAEAAPNPWYPSAYARAQGIARDDLDPHLDQLRMAGLIHLTDWVQGHGQGYALTPEGEAVLHSPRDLAKLRAGKLDQLRKPSPEFSRPSDPGTASLERGEEIRAAFLYPSPPVISLSLIFLNVAWFLPEILLSLHYQLPLNEFLVGYTKQPDRMEQVLSETGALQGIYIVRGQWWRLLSCCFVHVGLIHLGFNMWALYVVGPFFEQLWGRGRFLVLYLIAGLGGSCAMVIANPMVLGAGASGAIMGLLTAHVVWILFNRRYLPPALASQMLRRILFILIIQVVFTHSVPNISAAAHYGGGVAGAVAAFLLNSHRFGGALQRKLALLGLLATPVLCIGAVIEAERIDPKWDRSRIAEIDEDVRRAIPPLLAAHVEPFEHKPLKLHSLPDVQEAILGLEKARGDLYAAADRLQKLRPAREPALEDYRKAKIEAWDGQAGRWEQEELRFMEPLLNDLISKTGRVYEEQYEELQKSDQRTPSRVDQAIGRCREARLEVEDAVNFLRGLSPFHNRRLEARRLHLLERGEESLRGWERTDERLRNMAKPAATPPPTDSD